MKLNKSQITYGAALLGGFAAFCRWHSPKAKPLTKKEIDHYLDIISHIPMPDGENEQFVAKLREWAEVDDGKPVHTLNLIRFRPELRRLPGAPEFDGTPQESNAYYEKSLASLWLRNATYPIFEGKVPGRNLIATRPHDAPWSVAKVVRCPSRRRFLQLLSHPSYAPLEPYKMMSMELDLVPISGGVQIPDARWIVGGTLLALFTIVGRSRRRPA